VLRWFHSLVWALLAAACFVQASQVAVAATIGSTLALLALLAYIIFLGTMFIDRMASR
jgi:hypothetical protein